MSVPELIAAAAAANLSMSHEELVQLALQLIKALEAAQK